MNNLNNAIIDHEEKRLKQSNVGFHRPKDFISRNINFATSATHDAILDSSKSYFNQMSLKRQEVKERKLSNEKKFKKIQLIKSNRHQIKKVVESQIVKTLEEKYVLQKMIEEWVCIIYRQKALTKIA